MAQGYKIVYKSHIVCTDNWFLPKMKFYIEENMLLKAKWALVTMPLPVTNKQPLIGTPWGPPDYNIS